MESQQPRVPQWRARRRWPGTKPGKPGSPQLSVQAGRILKNAGFNEATRAHAHDLGWSPGFVAELGMRGMMATEMRMMLNPEGKSVPVAAPLFSINLAYFKVFWPILAGAEPPSTQPAGPVPPPPPVGGLPQTSELPQPIAEKLAVMQNASPQERMAMREGVTAAAKYAALAKKDEKQSAAPEIAILKKCSCEVGNDISSDARPGLPPEDVLVAELGHIHRDYSLNDAQRREMLREIIESARANLSPAMRRLFNDCVDDWMNGGAPPSELELQLPWIPDYISKPVGIREFIHNPVFLGQALGASIYPRIEDDLEELYAGNYPEVLLAGAVGWGKTRMSQVGILYDLYLVRWGELPKSTLQALKELTIEHRLCIRSGDLLLLDGRWYVTHTGLVRLARRSRCAGISVEAVPELSEPGAGRWAFKATVYRSAKCKGFVGYGDADPSNVSDLVRGAEMRVAETRAVNRALRKAYGIGLCSVEEIGSLPRCSPASVEKIPPQPSNNGKRSPGNHMLRDRLCQIIRQHRLDPAQIKLYAAEHCGTAELRDSTREQIESFVNHLAEFANRDRQALLQKLGSFSEKAGVA